MRLDLQTPSAGRVRRLRVLAPTAVIALCMGGAAYFGALFVRGKYQDWFHLYHGAQAVAQGANPYEAGIGGYIYPPLFAVLFAPLGMLPQGVSGLLFALLSGAMVTAALWLLSREVCRALGLSLEPWRVWSVALVALLLNIDKVRAVLYSGQSDHLVVLSIAGALALARRWPMLAGVCLGLGAVIKYQSLVFLPYLLVRRRWQESAGVLGGFVLGLVAGVPVFGWETNLAYVGRSVGGLARVIGVDAGPDAAPTHPITWDASVSITSALARMTGYPEQRTLFVLLLAGVVGACAAFGWWVLARAGHANLLRGGAARERSQAMALPVCVEWCAIVTAIVVLSPQSVGRHFVLMLLPLTLLAAMLLHPRSRRERAWLIGAAALYVGGLTLPPGDSVFEAWLARWEYVGGAGWCAAVMMGVVGWWALRRGNPDRGAA